MQYSAGTDAGAKIKLSAVLRITLKRSRRREAVC